MTNPQAPAHECAAVGMAGLDPAKKQTREQCTPGDELTPQCGSSS